MANNIRGITVEINGETQGLQNALRDVNRQSTALQGELREVDRALRLDPSNVTLLGQRNEILAQQVSNARDKLQTLQHAQEQVEQQFASGDIGGEQYRAFQRELINTENQLKNLENQLHDSNEAMMNAGSAANDAGDALERMASKGEKIKSVGDNISKVGEKLLPVTAAVTGLGTAAVATAANFESSMSQVQATMGITKDSMSTVDGQSVNTMDTLGELAKKMGAETAFSASECAEALNYLALAGYDTQEMCDTLPTVLNLAAAGDIELALASDMVTDAMSALGMGVDEAGTMVDQMAKTASSTNTSVAQLGEGILTIGATAKSVKGGTAELNTALGILANNGIKGAEGGTHLRNIILSLQNPTDKAAASMESLGVQTYDSQGNMRSMNDILGDLNKSMDGMTAAEKSNIIATIFNKTDLSSVNALLANTGDTWDDLQQSIADSGGAAQQMADTQLDNLQGQITILKSALEGLAISFGELLMPAIKQIVGWVQKFVDWLKGMDEGTKKVVVTVALFAAALGPVLIVVGKVISAVGTIMAIVPKIAGVIKTVQGAFAALNATMLANPIILIIAAIAALIAIFTVLWNKCDWFREFWIGLWENIKESVSIFVDLFKFQIEVIKTVFEAVKNFFSDRIGEIKVMFSLVGNWFKDTFVPLFSGAMDGIKAIFGAVKDYFTSQWELIKAVFTGIISFVKDVFRGDWSAAWEDIKGIFKNIWDSFEEIAKKPLNAVIGLVNGLIGGINKLVDGLNGINIKVPDWVPGVGGNSVGFSIPYVPNVPYLAKGGILSQGSAVVGEAGAELLTMYNGRAIVQPLGNDRMRPVTGGTYNITNIVKVEKISNDFDVTRINERLAFEQKRQLSAIGG